MPRIAFFTSLRAAAWLVLALMLIAIGYSIFMSIRYWGGIGV